MQGGDYAGYGKVVSSSSMSCANCLRMTDTKELRGALERPINDLSAALEEIERTPDKDASAVHTLSQRLLQRDQPCAAAQTSPQHTILSTATRPRLIPN
jgi:hypothetical protein